jgi:intein/homing endonuclease
MADDNKKNNSFAWLEKLTSTFRSGIKIKHKIPASVAGKTASDVVGHLSSKNYFYMHPNQIYGSFDRMLRYSDYAEMQYCLHEDTKIAIPGGYKTIKQLADEYGTDKEFIVYSYDHNKKKIIPALGKQARKTRTDHAWKVTLSDESEIIGTGNHRLLTVDGYYAEILNLKVGDVLMPSNINTSNVVIYNLDRKYINISNIDSIKNIKLDILVDITRRFTNDEKNCDWDSVCNFFGASQKEIDYLLQSFGFNSRDLFEKVYNTTFINNGCLENEYELHPKKIESIEYYGVIDLYDLTVDGYKNFATDSVISHNTPEINSALNIYAEEITSADENGNVLKVISNNSRIKGIVESLFADIINIDYNLYSWARNLPVRKDTIIPLLDGRNVTIEELSEIVNSGEEVWTYSVQDGTQNTVPGKITWCDKTRNDSELIRVVFDDGTYLDTTPDHEYILRNGQSTKAEDLSVGQSLMPFYRNLSSKENGDSLDGYEKVYNPSTNYYKYTHRLVARSALSSQRNKIIENAIKPIEKDNINPVVHHVDFDKLNNSPNNLQWMGDRDHLRYHANHCNRILQRPDVVEKRMKAIDKYLRSEKRRKRLSREMSGTYPKYFKEYNESELHKSHNNLRAKAMRNFWLDEDKARVSKEKMKKNWAGNKKRRDSVKKAQTINFDNKCISFIKNEIEHRNSYIKINDLQNILSENKEYVNYIKHINKESKKSIDNFIFKSHSGLSRKIKQLTGKSYSLWFMEQYPDLASGKSFERTRNLLNNNKKINHKIIDIIKLEEKDDVYCMTVRGPEGESDRHNFATCGRSLETGEPSLNSGVYLRNCKYGDFFLYVDIHPSHGIQSVYPIPVDQIEREEGFDVNDPLAVRFNWITNGNQQLENFQVVHFRLLGDDYFLPYGMSVLEGARRVWRQLCHSPRSKVWTEFGWKYIKDVVSGDVIYTHDFDSKETFKSGVVDCRPMGTQKIYKVRTNRREIEVTANHGLLVKDHRGDFYYKKAIDLIYQGPGGKKNYSKRDKLVLPVIDSGKSEFNFKLNKKDYSYYLKDIADYESVGSEKRIDSLNLESSSRSAFGFLRATQSIRQNDAVKLIEEFSIPKEIISKKLKGTKRESITNENFEYVVDKKFMRFFGFMFGDGWVTPGRYRVGFALKVDEERNELYKNLLEELSGANSTVTESEYYRGGQVNISSKEFSLIMRELGFDSGFENKRVPGWVFEMSRECKIEFLRGFFDADGSKNDGRISSSNLGLLEDLQVIAHQCGVATGSGIKLDREASKKYDKSFDKVVERKDSYRLYVNLKNITDEPVTYEYVCGVDYVGEEETYDLEVDHELHNFVADGVVSHNTLLEDAVMVYRLVRCLHKDSKVWTVDGIKSISDINVGDSVYSYDYNNNKLVTSNVTDVVNNGSQQIWKVKSKHRTVKANFNHPILVKNIETGDISYVKVEDLEPNIYQFFTPNLEQEDESNQEINQTITSIEKTDEFEDVWDIRVESDLHNFIADGVVVHNSPERRVFKIDVGNIPPEHVDAFIEKVRSKMKRQIVVNEKTGRVDLRYSALPIHKDSPIPLLDGRTISIESLAKEFKEGKENWVYSIQDDTHQIVPGKIKWAGKNYTTKKIIKVNLDDDTFVKTAPEHPFILRDGSSIAAEDLKPGMALMPFYRFVTEKKPNNKGRQYIGYEKVYNIATQKYETTHSLVAKDVYSKKWKKTKNPTVHHKSPWDGAKNKRNNHPDNLEVMNFHEHLAWHRKHAEHTLLTPENIEANRKRLIKFNKDEDFQAKRIQALNEYNNKEETRIEARNRINKYNNSKLHKEHNDVRSQAMQKIWDDDQRREEIIENMKLSFDEQVFNYIVDIASNINKSKISADKFCEELKNNKEFIDYLYQQNEDNNRDPLKSLHRHRVLSWIREFSNYETFRPFYMACQLINKGIDKEIALNHANEIVSLDRDSLYKKAKSLGVKGLGKLSKNKFKLLREVINAEYPEANSEESFEGYKNHKVLSIEVLDEEVDVYCMTIVGPNGEDDRHNFAVCSVGSAEVGAGGNLNHESDPKKVPCKTPKSLVNPHKHCMNGIFIFNTVEDDYFIPVRGDRGSDISTLAGGTYTGDIQDIEYLQCFRGNTKVKLLDGRDVEIKDLIDEINSPVANRVWLYSLNPDTLEVEPTLAIAGQQTGIAQELMRITLDNDEIVEVTPNHLMMLSDGTYKRADEIVENESLAPCYTRISSTKKKNYIDGYEMIYNPGKNRWEYTHRLVAKKSLDENLGKKNVVHHLSFDKRNNSPDFLYVCKNADEHKMIHAAHAIQSGQYAGEKNPNFNSSVTKEDILNICENCSSSKEIMQSLDIGPVVFFRLLKDLGYDNFSSFAKDKMPNVKDEVFYHEGKDVNINLVKELIRTNSDIKSQERLNEVLNCCHATVLSAIRDAGYKNFNDLYYQIKGVTFESVVELAKETSTIREISEKLEVSETKIKNILKENGFNTVKEFRKNYDMISYRTPQMFNKGKKPWNSGLKRCQKNHKVSKIERIVVNEPVYDIQVSKNSNFALSSGVFVHNSKLFTALQIPKAYLGYEETGNAQNALSQIDIRFNKMIQRIQRVIESELKKMAMIHLFCFGYEGEDLLDFDIKLASASVLAIQQKQEIWRTRLELMNSLPETVSKRWAMKTIMGFDDDELEEIFNDKVEEARQDLMIQNIAAGEAGGVEGGDFGGGGLGGGGGFDFGGGGGDSGLDLGDLEVGGEPGGDEGGAPEGGEETGGAGGPESAVEDLFAGDADDFRGQLGPFGSDGSVLDKDKDEKEEFERRKRQLDIKNAITLAAMGSSENDMGNPLDPIQRTGDSGRQNAPGQGRKRNPGNSARISGPDSTGKRHVSRWTGNKSPVVNRRYSNDLISDNSFKRKVRTKINNKEFERLINNLSSFTNKKRRIHEDVNEGKVDSEDIVNNTEENSSNNDGENN